MAQLTVGRISRELIGVSKRSAAANGRAAETEHRGSLRASLMGREKDFTQRAEMLRWWFHSSIESSDTVRAERDRESTA